MLVTIFKLVTKSLWDLRLNTKCPSVGDQSVNNISNIYIRAYIQCSTVAGFRSDRSKIFKNQILGSRISKMKFWLNRNDLLVLIFITKNVCMLKIGHPGYKKLFCATVRIHPTLTKFELNLESVYVYFQSLSSSACSSLILILNRKREIFAFLSLITLKLTGLSGF